jgi:hypothetical protein
MLHTTFNRLLCEGTKAINGITRNRKSKKDRQIHSQNKKEKTKTNNPQNTSEETKY